MLKTYIVVRFQWEGFHYWKGAPNEVDFLRKPHRHLFYGEVKIPVSHNDRQLEFFVVKRFLQIKVSELFSFDMGNTSCEMMCEAILKAIQERFGLQKGITVSVFEDNENGAVVES
jgi:hypothetical protein